MKSFFSQLSDILGLQSPERRYLFALAAVALVRFLNLGFSDMQAWDEAVYAVRSMGVVVFGAWIDQTAVAIDGLYSSFHPPLYIWLTALAQSIFGFTEFAARFFSAVAGGGTIFVLYHLGKELDRPLTGFVAALLFGLSPFVTFFSRQGQLDVLMTLFVALTILHMLRIIKGRNIRRNMLFAGIALGLSLLSRSYVGFGTALAFLAWIVLQKAPERRIYLGILIRISIIAFVIVGPWYLYMTVVHGGGNPLFLFSSADLWERMTIGFEGNVKPLGPLYYINQLIIILPLGAAWGVYAGYRIVRDRSPEGMFVLLNAFVFLGVFSIVRSKLAVYILPALIPFSLIAARPLVQVTEGQLSRRALVSLLGVSLIAVLWSIRQEWRDAVRNFLAQLASLRLDADTLSVPLMTMTVVCFAVIAVYVVWIRAADLTQVRKYLLPVMLVPAFVVMMVHILLLDRYRHVDGGRALAEYLDELKPARIVVAGYERNPQLTYYLRGADIGWRRDLHVRRIIPPADSLRIRIWLGEEMRNEPPETVLILEKDKCIRYVTIDALRVSPEHYALAFESRRYAVFVYVPFINLVHLMEGTQRS